MRDIKIGFAKVVGVLLTISLFLLSVVSLSSPSDVRSNPEKEVRPGIRDKGITLPHPPTNSSALQKGKNLGDYDIPWDVIDAGGGFATSLGYKLGGSLDQTAIGISHSDNYKVYAGYWGGVETTTVFVPENTESSLPKTFLLSQNYPNPFNPVTQIRYALPRDCWVRLEIYNILGQKVATLVDREERAGYKVARWDASSFSSGIYFYRLQTGNFVQTRKMILLK